MAGLTEAVLELVQTVGGMAIEQRQPGQMLRALLELANGKPKGRKHLDDLTLALIGRLDAHAGVMACIEAKSGQIGAAMKWVWQKKVGWVYVNGILR